MKRTGADLQNGWLSRHGTLYLTDQRLVFVPTVLDTALRARRREIALDGITAVERFPRNPGEIPRGGRRPRVLVHSPECVYEFIVGDMDAWIDALEVLYRRRARAGATHTPEILRDGYANPLLED